MFKDEKETLLDSIKEDMNKIELTKSIISNTGLIQTFFEIGTIIVETDYLRVYTKQGNQVSIPILEYTEFIAKIQENVKVLLA